MVAYLQDRMTDGKSLDNPMPHLCKGRWRGVCRDGGIVIKRKLIFVIGVDVRL